MQDLEHFDLDLLRVFDAIFAARSVSAAAITLGVSQASVSTKLTRLRLLLGDQLFERTRTGVKPTAKADRLEARISEALLQIRTSLRDLEEFSPATSTRRFKMALSDVGEAGLYPLLISRSKQIAPSVRYETVPLDDLDIAGALDRQQIDVAVGSSELIDRRVESAVLFQERFVVVARKGHPLFADGPPARAALGQGSYLVSTLQESNLMQILGDLDAQARIELKCNYLTTIPQILMRSDLISIVPETFGRALDDLGSFVVCALPVTSPSIQVRIYWQRAHSESGAISWLRNELLRVARR
jgi:DNA-binding transcriptional LysR family regulator